MFYNHGVRYFTSRHMENNVIAFYGPRIRLIMPWVRLNDEKCTQEEALYPHKETSQWSTICHWLYSKNFHHRIKRPQYASDPGYFKPYVSFLLDSQPKHSTNFCWSCRKLCLRYSWTKYVEGNHSLCGRGQLRHTSPSDWLLHSPCQEK